MMKMIKTLKMKKEVKVFITNLIIDEVNSANYEDEPVKNKIVLDEKAKKALKMTEPMNAKELELSKNIKMKLYDEFGMPLSDYDYA